MAVLPFLLIFTGGLTIAVYTMLHGVTAAPSAGAVTRIGRISAPSVAAFAIAFGAVGYLCLTHTTLAYPVVALIALGGGAATIPLSAPLLARLARNRDRDSAVEATLEGQPARVLSPVGQAAMGEIVYQRDGAEVRQRALNLLSGTLAAGSEVVIDKIDDGIAYVEDWDSVEKRL